MFAWNLTAYSILGFVTRDNGEISRPGSGFRAGQCNGRPHIAPRQKHVTASPRGSALRHERGWTQAQLGERLGLSQARLSEVERGGGSFTAEQLLAVLELFNVPISEFLPKTDPEDALQNALIQLGAAHLRQVPGVAPDGRYPGAEDVVQATLLGSRAPRLVTALAPVLLHQVEWIALPRLRA